MWLHQYFPMPPWSPIPTPTQPSWPSLAAQPHTGSARRARRGALRFRAAKRTDRTENPTRAGSEMTKVPVCGFKHGQSWLNSNPSLSSKHFRCSVRIPGLSFLAWKLQNCNAMPIYNWSEACPHSSTRKVRTGVALKYWWPFSKH
jgi:hypothetical protein